MAASECLLIVAVFVAWVSGVGAGLRASSESLRLVVGALIGVLVALTITAAVAVGLVDSDVPTEVKIGVFWGVAILSLYAVFSFSCGMTLLLRPGTRSFGALLTVLSLSPLLIVPMTSYIGACIGRTEQTQSIAAADANAAKADAVPNVRR